MFCGQPFGCLRIRNHCPPTDDFVQLLCQSSLPASKDACAAFPCTSPKSPGGGCVAVLARRFVPRVPWKGCVEYWMYFQALYRVLWANLSARTNVFLFGGSLQLSAFCIRKPLDRREIQKKVSAGRTAPSCAAAHHRNTRKRSAPDWNRRTHHQFLCPRHSVVLLSYTGRFFVYCLLFTDPFNSFCHSAAKSLHFLSRTQKMRKPIDLARFPH